MRYLGGRYCAEQDFGGCNDGNATDGDVLKYNDNV